MPDRATNTKPISIGDLRALYDAWQAEIRVPGSAETEAFHALEDVIFDALPGLLDEIELRPRAAESLDWDAILAAAPSDFPERLAENFNDLLAAETKAVGRLLDWVGVATMTPLRERVLILCAEYVSRTGQMPLDEALDKGREVLDRG